MEAPRNYSARRIVFYHFPSADGHELFISCADVFLHLIQSFFRRVRQPFSILAHGFRSHAPRTKYGTLDIRGFTRRDVWSSLAGWIGVLCPRMAACLLDPRISLGPDPVRRYQTLTSIPDIFRSFPIPARFLQWFAHCPFHSQKPQGSALA